MKKTTKPTKPVTNLRLDVQTVRHLNAVELTAVAGGQTVTKVTTSQCDWL